MAILTTILLSVLLVISGCTTQPSEAAAAPIPGDAVEFVLQTAIADGRLVFVGRGGDIEGIVNPDLVVPVEQAVSLTIINGDGMPHDLSIPDLGLMTRHVNGNGDTDTLNFVAGQDQEGTYTYFCTVSGHRQAGMVGQFIIKQIVDSES